MARKRREAVVFNVAFLDIMSCGFGAIILFYVIINHAQEERSDDMTADVSGEVSLMETEVKLEELNLAKLQNTLAEIEEEVITANGASERVLKDLDEEQEELAHQENETASRREHLNQLITDLKSLDEQLAKIKQLEEEGGEGIRRFVGEGDRQYLTGLRIGGERILIFLDASASMLDGTLVNVIRRRNLPDEQKIRSAKWQRALRTIDWITTQIPPESKFQIYTFNMRAAAALAGTEGQWLDPEDGNKLDEVVARLRNVVPENGTRLFAVVEAMHAFRPLPDNVILITDGLPTQGQVLVTDKTTVTSKKRERFFREAFALLPVGVPVNTILFPMEGDPMAASNFWRLAIVSGGSFMAPSKDWP